MHILFVSIAKTNYIMITNITKKTKMHGKNSLHSFDILNGMGFKCSTQFACIGQPLTLGLDY